MDNTNQYEFSRHGTARHGTARMICAVALFALLAYAGALKLNDPKPSAEFLASLIYWPSHAVVRGFGAIEVIAALWLLSGVAIATAGLVSASLFASFGVVHVLAAVQGVQAPCGCLGKSEALSRLSPEWWVGLSLVAVAMGVFIASAPREVPPSYTKFPTREVEA